MNQTEALALGPAKARAATACRNGHPFDEANTAWTRRARDGRMRRQCRKCHRDRMRARRAAEQPQPRKEKPIVQTPAPQRRSDTCQQGHPLVGDNLRVLRRSDGKYRRECVTCRKAHAAAWSAERREKTRREREAAGLPPLVRGRSGNEHGRVRWETEVTIGDDGRVYATAEAIEYERATEDSFRLAATRALRKWMIENGHRVPRGGWEPWGRPKLDFATDLPVTFSVRTIDPLPEVATRAA